MDTGFKNCTCVKDIGVTLQCCKIQGWRVRYSIDYTIFFYFSEYEKIILSIRVGLGRTMPRKTDFQVNFDTNSSIAMHVIAQFEAVNISITPCLRICISTTDYPTHTAFSPSRANFCPLCPISKSR